MLILHLRPAFSRVQIWFILLALTTLMGGCASYAAPGKAADFRAMGVTRDQLTDSGISEALAKQPLAILPCGIAAVRIQAPGYRSATAEGWGTGKYSVITTRDIEKDEQFDHLGRLPMIKGIAPINRLLLPDELNSDIELRKAAAVLHADMLLIYTLDTTFHTRDEVVPLTVITLGLSPNQVVHVISTASAILIDTRNGYLYGYAEATEKTDQLTSGWTKVPAIDAARRRAEEEAFDKLTRELEKTWGKVVTTYARAPG
jgi:hypothetical protein